MRFGYFCGNFASGKGERWLCEVFEKVGLLLEICNIYSFFIHKYLTFKVKFRNPLHYLVLYSINGCDRISLVILGFFFS